VGLKAGLGEARWVSFGEDEAYSLPGGGSSEAQLPEEGHTKSGRHLK